MATGADDLLYRKADFFYKGYAFGKPPYIAGNMGITAKGEFAAMAAYRLCQGGAVFFTAQAGGGKGRIIDFHQDVIGFGGFGNFININGENGVAAVGEDIDFSRGHGLDDCLAVEVFGRWFDNRLMKTGENDVQVG